MRDGEKCAVLPLLPDFAIAPDTKDFASIADMVRNVLDITVIDSVMKALRQIITDQRFQMVFAGQETMIETVILSGEEDPVVLCLEGGRVVVDDGGVGHPAMVGVEAHHLLVLLCQRPSPETETIDDNIRGIEL